MAISNKDNPNCPNCNKGGLAILPVRYAVVPNSVDAKLPESLGNKVTDVQLKYSNYALRTLRQGFLYLFYEKHARGSNIKWETYSVAANGTLWKQLSTAAIRPVGETPPCAEHNHRLPSTMIAIERPDQCGRIWMAFSEHCWSDETFAAMEADVVLRDRRMQTFSPTLWISKKTYRHGLEATQENLNEVIEYKSDFVISSLTGGPSLAPLREISQPDGTYHVDRLQTHSSIYPMHIRRDTKKKVVEVMKLVGHTSEGKHYSPVILALWDCVGIVHELNGYRNSAAGWIAKYGKERELEIGALVGLTGVKKALEDHERKSAFASDYWKPLVWSEQMTHARLAAHKRRAPNDAAGHARERELCGYWERDADAMVPAVIAKKRETGLKMTNAEWQRYMATVDAQASAWTSNNRTGKSETQQRHERNKRRGDEAAEGIWSKYKDHVDIESLQRFERNYTKFGTDADKVIDDRTGDLLNWLESTHFMNALTEFSPTNEDDGAVFEDQIGTALMGIGSTISGQHKIDEWIAEMKITEKNLIWRVIALNQMSATEAVNDALAQAVSAPKNLTAASWNIIANEIKWNKIFDLAKKSLGFYNTNMKATTDATSGITPVKETRGLEKILLAVGSRLRPLAGKIDIGGLWVLTALLAVRAGAEPLKVINVVIQEIRSDRDYDALIRRLRNHNQYLPGTIIDEFKGKTSAWQDLIDNAEVPDAKKQTYNAARDGRLALVVAIFEGLNLWKLSEKLDSNPTDTSIKTLLLAAQLATASAAIDLASNFVKGLHSLKDNAVGYQALKLIGGGLSSAASFLAAREDKNVGFEHLDKSQYQLAILYFIRGGFQFISGSLTVLMSLSYCSPVMKLVGNRLVERSGERAAGRVAGAVLVKASGRLLAMRAALFLATLEVSIFVLALSMVIWYFDDNELQKWCDRSAFGKTRKSDRLAFTSAERQSEELLKAIADVT